MVDRDSIWWTPVVTISQFQQISPSFSLHPILYAKLFFFIEIAINGCSYTLFPFWIIMVF